MPTSNITTSVDMSWTWIRQHSQPGRHCSQCSIILPYQCNILELSSRVGEQGEGNATRSSQAICDTCKDKVDLAMIGLRDGPPGAIVRNSSKD